MINLIIMVLIGSGVGVLFMNATNPPMLQNFFIFGFATMGLIATIRSIVSAIRGISVKRKDNLAREDNS